MTQTTNAAPGPAAVAVPDFYRGGLRAAFAAGAHLSVETDNRVTAVEWQPRHEGDPTPWRTLSHSRHPSAAIIVTMPGDAAGVPVTVAELVPAVRRAVWALDALTLTPDPARPGVFVVAALRVRPTQRGKGWEGRALRRITDWAELFAATLTVPAGPTRPEALFRAHGFVPAPGGELVRTPARPLPVQDMPEPAAPRPRTQAPVVAEGIA